VKSQTHHERARDSEQGEDGGGEGACHEFLLFSIFLYVVVSSTQRGFVKVA
jgi:hypothetical protein